MSIEKPTVKKPKPKNFARTRNKAYHTKTPEERAEQARINGAKTAMMPRDGYKKAEKYPEPTPSDEDMLADIYNPKAKYPPEVKIQAATCFMLTGTLAGASRMTGLKTETIWDWKTNSEWWEPVLTKVKKDKQEELDALLTKTIHNAVGDLVERLTDGEEVVVKGKDGTYQKIKKAVSARDLTSAIGTLYDKRTMLRGDPTSITRRETSVDLLNTLREEFTKMAKQAAKQELDKTVVN